MRISVYNPCKLMKGAQSRMAGENKKDAYVRLGHILIVLLVFTAIAVIGFFYARNTVNQQLAQLQEQRDTHNAERIELH